MVQVFLLYSSLIVRNLLDWFKQIVVSFEIFPDLTQVESTCLLEYFETALRLVLLSDRINIFYLHIWKWYLAREFIEISIV